MARFRTADVSPEQRFAAWHEMTAKALISTTVTSENVDNFAAAVSVLDLGVVQISVVLDEDGSSGIPDSAYCSRESCVQPSMVSGGADVCRRSREMPRGSCPPG
ncbi:hypothetical protein [Acrocarpospora corrugata]|uniref:hypothetical protein n=1 Tax=Acrocarpospora corrugata TaxID=35763 RepID=UPI0012D308AC|nr:hypothetical protein [Acrocarpospora corrugata]